MGGIKTAKWSENETIHPGSPEDDHSSLNLSRGEMTRATGLTLVSPLVTIPLLLAKHLFPLPPTQPVFCGGDFHKSVTSAIAWAFLIDSISFGKGREVGQPQWSALFPFFFACSAFALSCIPYKLRRERRCGLRKKSFFHLRVNCPRMNTTAPRDGPPCRSLYCRDGAAFDIRLCSKLFS